MRLSRAERSLLVDWWFTVDRVLLADHPGDRRRGPAAVAGGQPVDRPQARTADVLFRRAPFRLRAGERRPAAGRVAAVAGKRAAALAGRAARVLGADGDRSRHRRRDQRRAALAALRRLFAAALRVRQAGFRRALRLADRRERAPARHAGDAAGRCALPRVRRPARAAARRRPDAAREPGVVRAVPAGRPVAHAGSSAWRRGSRRLCSLPT